RARGREHRRRRVDGDDAAAERRHCGGEEAGAGAEVDERRIRAEAEPLKELHVDADVEAGLRVVSGDVRGIEMLAAGMDCLVEAHSHVRRVDLPSTWTVISRTTAPLVASGVSRCSCSA